MTKIVLVLLGIMLCSGWIRRVWTFDVKAKRLPFDCYKLGPHTSHALRVRRLHGSMPLEDSQNANGALRQLLLAYAVRRLSAPNLHTAASRRTAIQKLVALSTMAAPLLQNPRAAIAAPGRTFAAVANDATGAFQRADYAECERLWREAAEAFPGEALAWGNLAVVLVIRASDEMQLGVAPTGKTRERLDEAIVAIDQAESIGLRPDPLNLNTKGNALGLLLRWDDALSAYAASADASPRDFESIPRSNEALVLFELGQLMESEKKTRLLLRRDPGFVDGKVLLALLRFEDGDRSGAANMLGELCSGTQGALCPRYSSIDAVLGRWTPRAVAAYRNFLKEPSIQRELRNAL